MRAGVALALLLVVSAGCSSLSASPTETATLTPVPLESDPTPTPAPRELAPGIRADGVTDPFAAAAAHRQRLSNASFAVEERLVVRDDSRTLRVERRDLRAAPGGLPYRYSVTGESGDAYPVRAIAERIDLYYDGDETLFRLTDGGTVSYERHLQATEGSPVPDPTDHHRLLVLYDAADFEVTPLDNGSLRLTATEGPDSSVLHPPALLSDPRDASLTVLVAPTGQVRAYRLTYLATFEGRSVVVSRDATFSVASGPVEPEWLAEARNATA